eukprot:jgi/Mesvir1/12980/Mv05991-RA.1
MSAALASTASSMAPGSAQKATSTASKRDRSGNFSGTGKKSIVTPPRASGATSSSSHWVERCDEARITLPESSLGKNRLVWTPDLHARFLAAIKQLGLEQAVPRTILKAMNVEGMSRENVASHLQKYRIWHRRQEPTEQAGASTDDSSQGTPSESPSQPKSARLAPSSAVTVSRPSTKGQHRMHPYAAPAALTSTAATKLPSAVMAGSAGSNGNGKGHPAPEAGPKPGQPGWPLGKHTAARSKPRDASSGTPRPASIPSLSMKGASLPRPPPAIAIPVLSADTLAELALAAGLPLCSEAAADNVTAPDASFSRTGSTLSVSSATYQAVSTHDQASKSSTVATSVSLASLLQAQVNNKNNNSNKNNSNLQRSTASRPGGGPLLLAQCPRPSNLPGARSRQRGPHHREDWQVCTNHSNNNNYKYNYNNDNDNNGADHANIATHAGAGESEYLVIDWPTLEGAGSGALVLKPGHGPCQGLPSRPIDIPRLAEISLSDLDFEASIDSVRSTGSGKLGHQQSPWGAGVPGWGSLDEPLASPDGSRSADTWRVGAERGQEWERPGAGFCPWALTDSGMEDAEAEDEFLSGLLVAVSSGELSIPDGADSGRGSLGMEEESECTSVLLEGPMSAPRCLDDVMPGIMGSTGDRCQQQHWGVACGGGGDVGVFVGDLVVEPCSEGASWSGVGAGIAAMAEATMPHGGEDFSGYLVV